jgi:hypothetical protein
LFIKELAMLKRISLVVCVAALAALATPSRVCAYGAAHAGYTHVGPNGAYHVGATEAGGYRGGYAGGAEYRGGAAGGAEYRGGAVYGERGGAYGGAAYGGAAYRYAPSNGASNNGVKYGTLH